MKSCAYAYAIVTSHTNKIVNVFKMKKLEKIIMSNPKEMNRCRVVNS